MSRFTDEAVKHSVITMAVETADGWEHKEFATLDEAMAWLDEFNKRKVEEVNRKLEEARRLGMRTHLTEEEKSQRQGKWLGLKADIEEVGRASLKAHGGPEEAA